MNKPEKKFSCGSISVSIWANTKVVTGETVKFYSVTINKAYKEGEDWKSNVNPDSLNVLTGCKIEPSMKDAKPETRIQFERLGYFCVDEDSSEGKLVFNRTVSLRDTWAKIKKKQK